MVSRVTDLFLTEMQHAWENVLALELEVDRVESNPQLVQIIPANEVVVLISFELTVGETRGMVNLCIPFNSIERISHKLTSNSWISYSKRPPTPESIQQLSDRIAEAPVELVVELVEWLDDLKIERLGLDAHTYALLGLEIPYLKIPVRPGRDLTMIIEVAARNHLLRRMGFNAAVEFDDTLHERLSGRQREMGKPDMESLE